MKKSLFLTFFIHCFCFVFAQKNDEKVVFKTPKIVYDTLFVYDTIVVTDTVRLLRKTSELSALNNKSLNTIVLQIEKNDFDEKILIINRNFAATYSSKDMSLLGNKKSDDRSNSMKKITFFGAMNFLFQNMVIGQDKIAFSIGSGFYNQSTIQDVWITPTQNNGKKTTPLASIFRIGSHFFQNITDDGLALDFSLNYYYMLRSDFEACDCGQFQAPEFYIGGDFSKKFHQFSLPILIKYKQFKLEPFVGGEIYYKLKPYTANVSNNNIVERAFYKIPILGYGINMGFDWRFAKKYSLRSNYAQSLNKELADQPNGNQYKTTIRRLEIGLMYRL